MRTIKVVPYDPKWQNEFKKAKAFYERILDGCIYKIEHVGSTSVEGLYAKPILDIDIIVPDKQNSEKVIASLSEAGYVHQGNMGIVGREAFKYDMDNPKITWMDHHLYVCLEGSGSLQNHLHLRAHLRKNPDAVKAYSEIKRKLAEEHPHDIDSYIEGKTTLITSFLAKEGMSSEALSDIRRANRKNSNSDETNKL